MTAAMGVLLLCLSFLGYSWVVWSHWGVDREFIPIVVFSLIGCVIYLGGLANALQVVANVVLLIGLILLVVMGIGAVVKHRHFRIHIRLSDLLLLCVALAFFQLLCRSHLIHYDNFSHWGIVVKQMLSTNAFPTADSDLIDFKNYPLGTASFIYYVCLFAGHSQSVMVVAQNLLIFACLFSFFGVITEKGRFLLYSFLLLGISTLTLFNLSIRTDNLLVDFVLPLYTLSLFSVVYRYRKEIRKGALVFTPIAGELVIIKSTGVLFAAFAWLFLIWEWFLRRQSKENWKIALLICTSVIFLSLAPYILWNWHVETALASVQNKFATSATGLASTEISKTSEQISELVQLFLQASVDLSQRSAMGIVVANVATCVCYFLMRHFTHKRWKLIKALVALDVAVILYYAGTLVVYIFSMPWDEASQLDGFERYVSSAVVLLVGGLMLCATVDIERSFAYRLDERPTGYAFKNPRTKQLYQQAVIVSLAVSLLLLLSELDGMQLEQDNYVNTLPSHFQEVAGDRWYSGGTEDEHSYLVYAPDTDSQVTNYYLQYISKYYLYASNVDTITLFYEPNMDNLLSQYDYLIIAESDESDQDLLSSHYGVSGEEGVYRIEKNGDTIVLEPE